MKKNLIVILIIGLLLLIGISIVKGGVGDPYTVPYAPQKITWDKSDYFKNKVQTNNYIYCIGRNDVVEEGYTMTKFALEESLKKKYKKTLLIDPETSCRVSYDYDNTIMVWIGKAEYFVGLNTIKGVRKGYHLGNISNNRRTRSLTSIISSNNNLKITSLQGAEQALQGVDGWPEEKLFIDSTLISNRDKVDKLKKLQDLSLKRKDEYEKKINETVSDTDKKTYNIIKNVYAYLYYKIEEVLKNPSGNNGGGTGGGLTFAQAKTNWGFKGFPKPTNVVNVPAGGNLKAAVAGGNKVVKLAPGTYRVSNLKLDGNTILEGAGMGKTIIKSNGHGAVILFVQNKKNLIIRNLTIDATGNGFNGIDLSRGPKNVLVENIEVFGAGRNNLQAWNPLNSKDYFSQNITFRNINSHGATGGGHCLVFRAVKGGQMLNSIANGCEGYGLDASNSDFIEIAGVKVTNSMGTKYPAIDHLYFHNNEIINNRVGDGPGLKIQRECGPAGHLHFQDNKIIDNKVQVRDWTYSCSNQSPHFAELVWQNNEIRGGEAPTVAIGSTDKLEVYGKNGSLTPNHPANGDPAKDGVGYKTRR